MTNRAPEEPRLRPVHVPGRFGVSWLNARVLIVSALVAIVGLFAALFFMMRERPLPHRRVDLPSAPDLSADISTAQEKLKANPQDLSAQVELGTLLFEKGKDSYVEAINELEEARDLGALDARIFYCLGIMYQEEGLYPFALTEYQRFLRHYPEDKEIRLSLAKLYYRMGMFSEAAGEYDRLKFSNPTDPLIEENLGLSLWGAKQMERALTSFGQLKVVGGEYARRGEFYLGQIALEAGQFQEAADHFNACVAQGTPLPGVADDKLFTGQAMALQKVGRFDEAKTAWENVLRVLPKDPKAKAGLREAEHKIAAAKRTKKK